MSIDCISLFTILLILEFYYCGDAFDLLFLLLINLFELFDCLIEPIGWDIKSYFVSISFD